MANIKSQIKRIGTNKKAQERNKAVKSQLKTAVRATREAVAAGDSALAQAALVVATKRLDKATSKGVIHANQAANRKSALAKAVAGLPAGSVPKAAPVKEKAPAAAKKPAAKAPAKAAAAK
jgi:small subunit ribosomal protein S20